MQSNLYEMSTNFEIYLSIYNFFWNYQINLDYAIGVWIISVNFAIYAWAVLWLETAQQVDSSTSIKVSKRKHRYDLVIMWSASVSP